MAEIQHLGEDSKGTVEQQHVKDSEIPRYGKDFKEKSKQQPVKSQELTDEQLRELAGVIGADWEPVAASLGFNEARIFKFKKDSPHHLEDLVFNMLVEWKQRNPPSLCQIEKLSRQLKFVGNDITQLLRDIVAHGEDSKGRGKQQPAKVSELTDQHLRQLAREVSIPWEILVLSLGFDEAQISRFKEETLHQDPEDQIVNMLVEWTQRTPPSFCQIETLSRQLNEVGRNDLALLLKEFSEKEARTRKLTGIVKSELFSRGKITDDDSELVQPPPSSKRRITGQFQPDSGGDTKAGNGTSSQPNLLKTLLEEFRKMTTGFTKAELLQRKFKLPYIAIAYINERGGSLTLEKYKVHLYIPRDALAKGVPQMVYVFVDPSAPPVDGVKPPYVVLSPMIQCGPPGLKFLDSVVLSFPHHANNKWELSTRMCRSDCNSDKTTPKIWQALDAVRDGTMVLSRDNKVVLLLKHFTRFVAGGVPCEESAKLVKTGAFGSLYDPSDARYAVRIHVWNNDPVAKEKVIDMEKDMGSKPLDVYRDLQVFYNQGDVIAKIDNIKNGWEIEEKTPKEQKMSKAAVWQLPSNSVTFDLTREINDGATASVSTQLDTSPPGCDSFVYQLKADSADSKWDWEGQEVRLSVRPKGGKCSLPTEIPDTKRPVEDTCRICHQNPSSDAGICAACWEQLKSAFTWNDDTERDGGLGGLSKETVKKLLRFLEDKSDDRCNWIHLAKELFGQETRLIVTLPQGEPTPANEILKLYFSFKREAGVRDHNAVRGLLEVFKRLGMNEAVQIMRAELNRQALRCTASKTYTRYLFPDGLPMDHSPYNCPTLSEVADERLFRQLAKQIGREWKELATNLGFTSQGIYHIETDNVNNVGEQIFTMLASWRKECVIKGTEWTRILPEKLKEIELPLLAEFVIAHASSPEVENSANEEQAQQVG